VNITARFENGIFRPLEAVSLREGTLVAIEVAIDDPSEVETKKPSVVAALDSDFFGLWKDRSDIEDSVQYVNQMRTRARD
jgi:predicted DNA-binding antitoxin AbrB/MazE fold protein